MVKSLVVSALAFFSGHFQVETKLDLFDGDQWVGSGSYRESFDHKGHRTSVIRLWSRADAVTQTTIVQTKVIDSQGFPIRAEETHSERTGKTLRERVWTVVFNSSGEAIVTERRGKRKFAPRTSSPIPGYSRADASDLWFSKTHPQPGTQVSSTVFRIADQHWQIVVTTFVGRKWISVGGRQVEANEVLDVRDGVERRLYLDDQGQPLLMRNGSLRTERHF